MLGLEKIFRARGHDETFLQENVNWMLLRGFGASKVASVSVLMPFVGYIILYNSELQNLFGDFGGLLSKQPAASSCPQYISSFQRLNLLYCGLFALGTSALVFRSAAPRELKLYSDSNDFIDRERSNLSARRVRSMYRTVNFRRNRIGEELCNRANWLTADVPITKASIEFANNKNEDVVLDLMRTFFQAQDRHFRRWAVFLCFFLLVIGAVLLAIPSGAFTIRVLCTVLSGNGTLGSP
ncbi:hypothetical protein [Yoonia sp. R2-816]|uniref:hypothetical protein n=1 Tax=Yoonia sp. R2-816 TaxID=3342638 RepID=UPI00372A3FAC